MNRLRQALQAPDEPTLDVLSVLTEAHQSRDRIELEPVTQTLRTHTILRTTIEQVREDSFVISQPVTSGGMRPLARFEPHHLRLLTSRGRITGQTYAIGRHKIPTGTRDDDGEEAFLYGYRLALPPTLRVVEQRQPLRALFGRQGMPEAQLHVLSHRGPILGVLEDLSAAGAKLRCRNAKSHLGNGGSALFKVDLPEPFGSIQQMVRIVGLESVGSGGDQFVRVAFDARNETIAKALRGDRRLRA